MKKLVSAILVLVMMVSALSLCACEDPLQEKGDELDASYAAFCNAYERIYELGSLAGVLSNKDETLNDAELQAELDEYKPILKDAKDVVAAWLDLTEEEMDEYIQKWDTIVERIYVLCEQFDGIESYLDSETEPVEETEG